MAGWILVSAFLFQYAQLNGRLIPAANNKVAVSGDNQVGTKKTEPLISFNAVVFAIDTLIPIVNFNQKSNWVVEPMNEDTRVWANEATDFAAAVWRVFATIPDRLVAGLMIFNTFFGWFLTTLFAGGVSGLLRRGN